MTKQKIKNIVMIYFSATGNTKVCSEELKKHFEGNGYQVDLISAEDIDALKTISLDNKLLGIGFPCYAFSYPSEVIDKALSVIGRPTHAVKAFVYATYCIGVGLSFQHLSKKLEAMNIAVALSGGFKCPSAGFFAIKSGQEIGIKKRFLSKVTEFQKDLKTSIKNYANRVDKVVNNQVITTIPKSTPINYLMLYFAKWNEKRIFNNYSIEHDKCCGCNQCINTCPVGNIKKDGKDIIFIDSNNCIRCMRCISHCPNDAITLGKKTIGKHRYTPKVKRKLLEKIDIFSGEPRRDE